MSVAVDVLHCGACDKECPTGATCEKGDCLCDGHPCCEAPLSSCSVNGAYACVDTKTDQAHCGACDVKCAADQACIQGHCTGCSPRHFLLPVAYPTGLLEATSRVRPIVEDLDADGNLDVLVPNTAGESISYFLGDGKGGLLEQPRLDTPAAPLLVRVGDLNRDGHKDIVTLSPQTLSVRWGGPDHKFASRTNHTLGDSWSLGETLGLELLNVVGDDAVDVVVLNQIYRTGLTAWAFQGGTSWTGTARVVYEDSISRTLRGFQAVDLSGDGVLDIAMLGRGVDGLFAQSSGEFEYQSNLVTTSATNWWALGFLDLNDDDRLDIAGITSKSPSWGPHYLRAALGNASGGFDLLADSTAASAGGYAPNFTFADIDGDRYVDALSRCDTANCVFFHMGSSSGAFETKARSEIAGGKAGMGLGDLTGDGQLDLVVAHESSSAVTVHPGKAGGSFESYMFSLPDGTYLHNAALLPGKSGESPKVAVVGALDDGRFRVFSVGASGEVSMTEDIFVYRPNTVTLSDIDGNGQLDAVVPAERSLYWLRNEGNGQFSDPVAISSTNCGYRALAGDLDGDGQKEVLASVSGGKGLQVFKRDPKTETWTESDFPITGYASLGVGDINGDKLDDVFAATGEFGTPSTYKLMTWLGSRKSLLEPLPEIPLDAHGMALRVADLDGDGYRDVFVATDSGYVTFRGDASASMAKMATGSDRVNFQGVNAGPDGLLVVDVDQDGVLDILATTNNDTGSAIYLGSGVALWRGQGDGSFKRTETYLVPGATAGVGLEDFDGDGVRDLLLSGGSPYGGSLMLLRGAVRCTK